LNYRVSQSQNNYRTALAHLKTANAVCIFARHTKHDETMELPLFRVCNLGHRCDSRFTLERYRQPTAVMVQAHSCDMGMFFWRLWSSAPYTTNCYGRHPYGLRQTPAEPARLEVMTQRPTMRQAQVASSQLLLRGPWKALRQGCALVRGGGSGEGSGTGKRVG
jgi:hypothetical protein